MDFFLAGTSVECVIPLQDKNGQPINASALSYRLIDQNNAELIAPTPVSDFNPGASEWSIVVPADKNVLGATTTQDTILSREARVLELTATVGGNTVMFTFSYAIEPVDTLVVGVNSFQSYASALLTAVDIPNTPGWDAASDNDRYAALIEARWHMCKLSYYLLNSNINFGQDSLNFVPEGVYQSKYVATNGLFMFDGNMELLNAEQFNALPERFKGALRKAQVAEADFILSDDPLAAKRIAGVTMDSVGQTRQMFRSTKPLDLPCCKRALSYVSYFVQMNKKLART